MLREENQQEISCALHFNELPLRALIRSLDGETFSEPIGTELCKDILSKPVIKFKSVTTNLSYIEDTVVKDLSSEMRF